MHGVKDSPGSMELGNVMDTGIREAWRSARVHSFRELHERGDAHLIAACDECSYRATEIGKHG